MWNSSNSSIHKCLSLNIQWSFKVMTTLNNIMAIAVTWLKLGQLATHLHLRLRVRFNLCISFPISVLWTPLHSANDAFHYYPPHCAQLIFTIFFPLLLALDPGAGQGCSLKICTLWTWYGGIARPGCKEGVMRGLQSFTRCCTVPLATAHTTFLSQAHLAAFSRQRSATLLCFPHTPRGCALAQHLDPRPAREGRRWQRAVGVWGSRGR